MAAHERLDSRHRVLRRREVVVLGQPRHDGQDDRRGDAAVRGQSDDAHARHAPRRHAGDRSAPEAQRGCLSAGPTARPSFSRWTSRLRRQAAATRTRFANTKPCRAASTTCGSTPTATRFFAVSSLDGHGQVRGYETDSGKKAWQIDVPEAAIYAVACSPDGATVAAAGADGQVRLIDAAKGQSARRSCRSISRRRREKRPLVRRSRTCASTACRRLRPPPAEQRRPIAGRACVDPHRETDRLRATALHGHAGPAAPGPMPRGLVQWKVEGTVGQISPEGRFTPLAERPRADRRRTGGPARGDPRRSRRRRRRSTCPASSATSNPSFPGWAATPARATVRPRARTASSSRSAATTPSSIIVR